MPARRFRTLFLCLLWLLAVAAGLVGMARYEQNAGSIGTTPHYWPAEASVALDPSRPTLLMFAHPKCPCTRASMEEFNRLLAQCHGAVAPHVLFFSPENGASEWTGGALWKSAKAIPGVVVETDPGGAKARLFGAETSGYVVLYNPRGELLFQGGITASRGHAGDNGGESAILSLLAAQDTSTRQSRVFGCALFNPRHPAPVLTTACTK